MATTEMLDKSVIWPTSVGSRFAPRLIALSCWRRLKELGREPDKRFWPKSSPVKDANAPKVLGIEPDKHLYLMTDRKSVV